MLLLGLHRILIWPDIRLNSKIGFFFRKKLYLYLVFNKSANRSLFYIDIILFVKTVFPAGYPVKETGYKKGWISGTTLVVASGGLNCYQIRICELEQRPHMQALRFHNPGMCWALAGLEKKPGFLKEKTKPTLFFVLFLVVDFSRFLRFLKTFSLYFIKINNDKKIYFQVSCF